MVSRFQFARPAVVFSFLLQIIFTPPVEAANLEISPLVILASSSERKDSARECLDCEKAFLASRATRSGLTGLFLGDVRRAPLDKMLSSPRSYLVLGCVSF